MISRRHATAAALCIAAALYTFGAYRQLQSVPVLCDFDYYYLPAAQLLKGMNPYLTIPRSGNLVVGRYARLAALLRATCRATEVHGLLDLVLDQCCRAPGLNLFADAGV